MSTQKNTTERRQGPQGLATLFHPRTVAVIGASSNPASIGHRVMRNIVEGGFTGIIHPVNPKARSILGIRAYPSVLDIDGEVDVALIIVPAEAVLGVVDECGRKGIQGLVVISAGFKEVGEAGAERERRLNGLVEKYGMRMIGPNCLGIINSDPDVRFNATFAPRAAPPGPNAMMSQSGALGVAILEHAADLRLGMSHFVSLGNKTNVSGNDLLELWEDDPKVGQILMYLESFGNPRNFVRIAPRIAHKKPVLVVKSGRSRGGQRAALSHTGALAEADRTVDALLEQCGIIRASTIEELFDIALATTLQPLPRGDRVAIVTNSGGPSVMAVDALEAVGFKLAALRDGTKAAIRTAAPAEASVENPVDLLGSGTVSAFRAALDAVLSDDGVDSLLVIYTPIASGDEAGVAAAIVDTASAAPTKPVLAVTMGRGTGAATFTQLIEGGVPVYSYPENAVQALEAMRRIAQWRARPAGTVPEIQKDTEHVLRILEGAMETGREWLTQAEAFAVLSAYGVPVVPHGLAGSSDEAVRAAQKIGYPVVLKGEAAGVVHKSEAGLVHLRLGDAAAVRQAWSNVDAAATRAGATLDGALVMQQVRPVEEVLLGVSHDPKFGAVLAFGLGGIFAETLKDVTFRLAPLTDAEAARMVRGIRALPLLQGARGRPKADLRAIERSLIALGHLAIDFPDLRELDVNPFMLHEEGHGAVAADARIRVRLRPPKE